jgi:hypothetical protein
LGGKPSGDARTGEDVVDRQGVLSSTRSLGIALSICSLSACAAAVTGTESAVELDAGAIPPGTADWPEASLPPQMTSDGASSSPVMSAGASNSQLCESRTIDTMGVLPDMQIVMDRSLSMDLFGRWDPSRSAVKSIVSDYGNLIRFGLSSFPDDLDPCGASPQPDVPIAASNGSAISARLDRMRTTGLTPTGAALTNALAILGDRKPRLDDANGRPAYVLLVTDGEPSCAIIPGIPDEPQQDAARSAIMALRAANIPTYVIGYQIDSAFDGLMNQFAELGGTMRYRPVENADQIVTTFREITKDVVKCAFDLSEVPADPVFVRITIDQKTVPLNAADGWSIAGKSVTLQGASCTLLRDGKPHLLNAKVECAPVVLL